MSYRSIFNSSIRFALTEERLQGFTELEGVSPQVVNYLRQIDLALWATPRLPGKRCVCNCNGVLLTAVGHGTPLLK